MPGLNLSPGKISKLYFLVDQLLSQLDLNNGNCNLIDLINQESNSPLLKAHTKAIFGRSGSIISKNFGQTGTINSKK